MCLCILVLGHEYGMVSSQIFYAYRYREEDLDLDTNMHNLVAYAIVHIRSIKYTELHHH